MNGAYIMPKLKLTSQVLRQYLVASRPLDKCTDLLAQAIFEYNNVAAKLVGNQADLQNFCTIIDQVARVHRDQTRRSPINLSIGSACSLGCASTSKRTRPLRKKPLRSGFMIEDQLENIEGDLSESAND
jgi:hypothetical protein